MVVADLDKVVATADFGPIACLEMVVAHRVVAAVIVTAVEAAKDTGFPEEVVAVAAFAGIDFRTMKSPTVETDCLMTASSLPHTSI